MVTDPQSTDAESAPSSSRTRTAPLAESVRRRRKELGLRQAEVAELAGCSERFLHTVEHGKASLRLDKVLDVLAVLGLDLVVAPGRGRMAETTVAPGEQGHQGRAAPSEGDSDAP